jgi:hypothetical protein
MSASLPAHKTPGRSTAHEALVCQLHASLDGGDAGRWSGLAALAPASGVAGIAAVAGGSVPTPARPAIRLVTSRLQDPNRPAASI